MDIRMTESEIEFLDSNYPLVPWTLAFPIVVAALSVVAGVLVGLFGESDITGFIVSYVAIGLLDVICVLIIVLQISRRKGVRDGVFMIDVENKIAFRYGSDLGEVSKRLAYGIADFSVVGGMVVCLTEKIKKRYSGIVNLWGPVTFCTFRNEGDVGAIVGGEWKRVLGVSRGRWIECSVLMGEDRFSFEDNWNLVQHELTHSVLTKIYPLSSTNKQHQIMIDMGIL